MLTLLYYVLKVIFCSAVLFSYYHLALRNNRFHQWNRYYLLGSVVVSFLLPLLKIPLPFFDTAEETPLIVRGVEVLSMPDIYISQLESEPSYHITWPWVAVVVYLAVVACLGFVFIKNIIKIKKLKNIYPCEFINGIEFYNTQEEGTPFSFFKSIFWNKRIDANSDKGQQMLAHELAHVYEKHSVDKVFMEGIMIVAPWNPVFYFVRRELSIIHEFIADQKASTGDGDLQYASLLLMKAMGSEQFALANPFFHSQLKRRLTMLTTSKNPSFSYARRLMVLPLAALALILFSFKYKEIKSNDVERAPQPITVVIDAGHGGIDAGGTGPNGILEKNITLQIAQKIKALSEGTNITVILSRNNDELSGNTNSKNASLIYRTALAKQTGADFFVSLHVDADIAPSKTGISACIGNSTTQENEQSKMLGSAFLNELSDNGLPVLMELTIKKNLSVYVLEKNTVPAVMLQLGYISNATDAAFIQDEKNQTAIAKDILNALAKHGQKIKETGLLKQPIQDVQLAEMPLNGFYQDSVKLKTKDKKNVFGKYKGQDVVSITATDDKKGMVVKTKDEKVYFLSREEAKKILDPMLYGIIEKAGTSAYDNLGEIVVESRPSTFQEKVEGVHLKADTLIWHGENEESPFKDLLWVIDGKESTEAEMKKLNPNQIQSVDVLKGESATTAYGEKGKNGVIKITTKKVIEAIGHPLETPKSNPSLTDVVVVGYGTKKLTDEQGDYDKIFTKTEVSPQFPGGIDGWRKYLERNLSYPQLAQNKSLQGVVRVQFLVQQDGSITDVIPMTRLGSGLEDEVIRLLYNGPKWIPAKQNGRTVTFRVSQSVTFSLQEKETVKPATIL